MKAKIGDTLKFKKVKWTIVKIVQYNHCGDCLYKYRVSHKHFGVWLSNTKLSYPCFDWRWEILKKKLKEDKNFHYTSILWSGVGRTGL